jgi:membrane protease YdiL (CAAX protease family)
MLHGGCQTSRLAGDPTCVFLDSLRGVNTFGGTATDAKDCRVAVSPGNAVLKIAIPVQLPVRWYLALLIPPSLILIVLFSLKALVSPVFTPKHFLMGVAFGFAAGFFEEIGWMGYAFPRMKRQHQSLAASVLLGLLWAGWHLLLISRLPLLAHFGFLIFWRSPRQ